MSRIEKALYLFPLMPVPDMFSTIWAISFGGQELNPITRFFMQVFGYPLGLIIFAILLSLLLLICVKKLVHFKSTLDLTKVSHRFVFGLISLTFFWFIGFWFSIVVCNFLFPLSLNSGQITIVLLISQASLFLVLLWFTRTELLPVILSRHTRS